MGSAEALERKARKREKVRKSAVGMRMSGWCVLRATFPPHGVKEEKGGGY